LTRRFPGAFVQGDTLATYCQELSDGRAALAAGDFNEASERLAALALELTSLLKFYVGAVADVGQPLPFQPTVDGSSSGAQDHTAP
jgi:hypothetical protein